MMWDIPHLVTVGEYALRDMVGHFNHNEQSLRMVEVLEKHGDHQGLNLTTAVRDGIVGHTGAHIPCHFGRSNYSYRGPHCLFVPRF